MATNVLIRVCECVKHHIHCSNCSKNANIWVSKCVTILCCGCGREEAKAFFLVSSNFLLQMGDFLFLFLYHYKLNVSLPTIPCPGWRRVQYKVFGGASRHRCSWPQVRGPGVEKPKRQWPLPTTCTGSMGTMIKIPDCDWFNWFVG